MAAPITTLSGLVSPLTAAEFRALLRDRVPRHVEAGRAAAYATLLDWQGLIDVVHDRTLPASKLRLTQRNTPLPPMFYRSEQGPRAEVVDRVMERGGSILVYGIEPHVPALARLCAAAGTELGEAVVASAVATQGEGGALSLHYDDADLLILQIEGSKRWLLHEGSVADPVPGMVSNRGAPSPEATLDVTLAPGDLLLMPAGWWHRCENRGDRSLHLSFFIYPLTVPRVLDLLMRDAVRDPAARAPLRYQAGEESTVEAELKRALIARIETLSLDDLRAEHRRVDPNPTVD